MKKVSLFLFLAIIYSCEPHPNPSVYPQNQTEDDRVIVVQRDDGSSFLMNYLIWSSLMNQGGVTQVNNYYNTNYNTPEFKNQQTTYKQKYDSQTDKFNSKVSKPVETKFSSGFGFKKVETKPSNGFGSKPVETSKSTGFGATKPNTNKNVNTNKSTGFGSKPSSSPAPKVTTKPSSGFGKKN